MKRETHLVAACIGAGCAALLTFAVPLAAQQCLGLSMPRKIYIGAQARHILTSAQGHAPVYGGRAAMRFNAPRQIAVTTSLSIGAGPMRADSTAGMVSGYVALSGTLPTVNPAFSLCLAMGFDANGVDVTGRSSRAPGSGNGFVTLPLSIGAGYDIRFGLWTITPFVASSVARYYREDLQTTGTALQRGWDGNVTIGAAAAHGRLSFAATSRHGDHVREGARMAFETGISF